jgi:hypothetical protein
MIDAEVLLILGMAAGVVALAFIFIVSLSLLSPRPPRDVAPRAAAEAWEIVRTYNTVESAYLDRAMLEGSGVRVDLRNEHTVGTDWLYGIAVGVDLAVPADQADHARQILGQKETPAAIDPVPVPATPADAPHRICERCGSAEVYRVRPAARSTLLLIILLGLPWLRQRTYECSDCGNRGAFSMSDEIRPEGMQTAPE